MLCSLADTAAPGSVRSAQYKLIGRLNLSAIGERIGERHDRQVSPVFNAEMRAQYLAETKLLTAIEVRAQSGLNPRNKSEPASRWKREGKIFTVRKGGVDLYPAFQFTDGAPKGVMKSVLAELAEDFTPWQIAFWFESGNGWLDGEAPQDCLGKPDEVVLAAKRLAEPTIG